MTLEEAQSRILELEEAVQAKDEQITSLTILQEDAVKKASDYEAEIQKLKENNMNLFLRVSQQPTAPIEKQPEPKPEKTGWDTFMSGW